MTREITLTVNGEAHRIGVKPWQTLLEVLRDELRLTGTKEGCGKGDCGACTVILDGKAVNSCLVLAVSCDGKEVLTIEGLAAGGELHPLQKAFIDHGAIQCGYCTPGMILSSYALLREKKEVTDENIRTALKGNICRCTGYVKIVEAVKAAARNRTGGKPK